MGGCTQAATTTMSALGASSLSTTNFLILLDTAASTFRKRNDDNLVPTPAAHQEALGRGGHHRGGGLGQEEKRRGRRKKGDYSNWMRLYSPGVCLRRSASCSMQSHSKRSQGGFTQSMALWKCSQSQSSSYYVKSGLVNFSRNKNTKSSDPQSLKYFVSLEGRRFHCGVSTREGTASIKLDMPSREFFSNISWNWRGMTQKVGGTAGGLCLGFSVSGIAASAESPVDKNINSGQTLSSYTSSTHGKKVYTDYSVTGIPGDGRCLFRSVVHAACVRLGKPIPNEDLQRKLADELRALVADEFVKRREETEWFVEGDFDTYVSQIRQPHVWGGEPELFMASHVLLMPITVYMHDEEAGGLITIAEYGQQYGREDPIKVLYHGFGHYDALEIPANRGPKTRLENFGAQDSNGTVAKAFDQVHGSNGSVFRHSS